MALGTRYARTPTMKMNKILKWQMDNVNEMGMEKVKEIGKKLHKMSTEKFNDFFDGIEFKKYLAENMKQATTNLK
jgi:hypothetical protein